MTIATQLEIARSALRKQLRERGFSPDTRRVSAFVAEDRKTLLVFVRYAVDDDPPHVCIDLPEEVHDAHFVEREVEAFFAEDREWMN